MNPSLQSRLTVLRTLRAEAAALEKAVATERASKRIALAQIHREYGFPDAGSFVAAVCEAAGIWPLQRLRLGTHVPRRFRARVTPETKRLVELHVRAGKTAKRIAHLLRISIPTVQNIKKDLGLVRARRSPSEK